jgi:hypothetical protein
LHAVSITLHATCMQCEMCIDFLSEVV